MISYPPAAQSWPKTSLFHNPFAASTPHAITQQNTTIKNSFYHTQTHWRARKIQNQTKFLQINAPNTPGNRAESHNRNRHKSPKSQQTVKNTQNALLYPNQQPLKRRKPAEIRHFLTQKPITTTDKQQFPPIHTDTSYTPDTHNALDTPEFQKTSEFTPLENYRIVLAHPNTWFIIL